MMRAIVITFTMFASLCSLGQDVSWQPVTMPWNKAPVNLSYLLDAPAGTHGFLGVKDGRLVFEDGTPLRLWGVSMNASACFPPHEHAPQIAERLARYGVNVVRMTNWDAPWVQPPLFHPDPNAPALFYPKTIDRLDYFIYQLANRGIYTYMDGLGARALTEHQQTLIGRQVPPGFAGAVHYAADLQAVYQGGLTAFWTHRNPYLGREYRDSPAIIMTQLFNDNTLNAESMDPLGFQDELSSQWQDWLRKEDIPFRPFNPSQPREEEQRFLAECLEQSLLNTAYHLRQLGVKCPIGGMPPSQGKDLAAQVGMDFTVGEAIMNAPRKQPLAYPNRSLFDQPKRNPPSLFARLAFSNFHKKPFIVAEWGDPWPNRFRAELPLWMAAMLGMQGWNGGIASPYTSLHETHAQHMVAPFALFNDPALFGLFPAAALMVHRRDVPPAREKITLNFSEADLFAEKQWTPGNVYPTRLIEHAQVAIRLRSNKSGSRIFQASQSVEGQGGMDNYRSYQALRRSADRGVIFIDTERTQALIGRLKAAPPGELRSVDVVSNATFGVVCVSSMNNRPISQSPRLLISVVSEAQNTDFESRRENDIWRIVNPGQLPIRLKTPPSRLFIQTWHQQWRIRPVGLDGEPQPPLPYQYMNGRLSFEIGTHGVMHYVLQTKEFEN